MSPDIEQARNEIMDTRARLAETADELKDTVSQRVERAKEAVNPLHYAREYPWIAIGLAVGAGLAIGLTGADKKAASAALEGAKSAGPAIAGGAVAAKDAIVDRFSGSDDAQTPEPETEESSGGLRADAASAVHDLLNQGLDEVLGLLGVTRDQARRHLPPG